MDQRVYSTAQLFRGNMCYRKKTSTHRHPQNIGPYPGIDKRPIRPQESKPWADGSRQGGPILRVLYSIMVGTGMYRFFLFSSNTV